MADEGGDVAGDWEAGDDREAVDDRDQSRYAQVRRIACCAVAGLVLIVGGSFGYILPVVMIVTIVAGVLLLAVAGLLLLRARAARR
jgi:hypothetical protein